MRPRQWVLSVFLFVVSVVFLFYSKTLLPPLKGEEASTTLLPAGSDCESVVAAERGVLSLFKEALSEIGSQHHRYDLSCAGQQLS